MAVAELIAQQQHLPSQNCGWFTPNSGTSFSAEVQAFAPDLLHVHGLWRAPNRLAARVQGQLPSVVTPHGMLDPWALAQHRLRKKLLWWAYERRFLHHAAALQALCPAERQTLRHLGIVAPIALIPNGVALPDPAAQSTDSLPPVVWASTVPPGEHVLLFLGRLHHKKGIQPLLQAWHTLATEATRAGWWLAFVGYGDDGQLERHLRAEPVDRAFVFGPVFAEAKAAVLRAASAFVLPSYSEGLPMAALEAMAYELPCLLSEACNLAEAFSAGAALHAEPDPPALADSIRQLFALHASSRASMGAAGYALVRDQFSWPVVAQQTRQLYDWILGYGECPDFVDLG
jgi:glycosyltransferase involved in cell wall biosynthesis